MNKARKFFNKIAYRFPEPLPFGMTEFNTWAQSILETYDFPNNDSFLWSIATIVQSLDQARADVSKYYISLRLRKGAANQLAGQIMWDLKQKQAAEQAALKLEEEKAAEAAAREKEDLPGASS